MQRVFSRSLFLTCSSSSSSSLRSTAPSQCARLFASSSNSGVEKTKVSLFPGDGIGPEISQSVVRVFESANVPIAWETYFVGADAAAAGGELISDEAIESVERNKVGLKGPMATPIGTGHRSLNLALRKALDLYANVRPCKSVPGLHTRYEDVDLVTIRENTEGEYSGLEHEVVDGVVESLKVITRPASIRVAEFAFDYAVKNKRSKVSVIHRKDVMRRSDGLFVDCCNEVAKRYPNIQYEEVSLDNCVMHLAMDPKKYDVMVLPNLYGDIVSDLGAGLIGGLGLTPSGNIGQGTALFEAVHGTAPDIAGKDLANPTALLLSGIMMLRYMGLNEHAEQINRAVHQVIEEGKYLTGDVGGRCTCTEYTNAIIGKL